MNGLVSQHVRVILARQVADHGVVVWYDPDQTYADAAGQLDFGDILVYHFDGSFYGLRKEIDKHLNGSQPPRLLIYVPVGQDQTHNALIGIESLGVVVKPGQQPPTRNTRLSVVARNALRPILGDEPIETIEKQVDEGQLTLADLDKLAESGGGRGVIAVIFGSSIPGDVGLAFLWSTQYDAKLLSKQALPELAAMFGHEFEVQLGDFAKSENGQVRETTPSETEAELGELQTVRTALARHVLCTELHVQFADELPEGVAAIPVPASESARQACSRVASHWRQRRDLRDSFAKASKEIAGGLNLDADGHAFAHRLLGHLLSGHRDSIPDTFLEVESGLQQAVVARMLDNKETQHQALVEFSAGRQSSFWSEQIPDVQAQWALIAAAGNVMVQADRIDSCLKDIHSGSASGTVSELLQAYTGGDAPWCQLDTAHRHMERRHHHFPFNLGPEHGQLEQLVIAARARYMQSGSRMAETFTRALADASFQIPDVPRQTQVYDRFVKSPVQTEKVAYVWVDALRYEMALELSSSVKDDYEIDFQHAIGTVPTITEIGMPSLLPIRDDDAKVVPVGKGKLALQIGDTIIKSRADRVKFLKDQTELNVVDAKLEDFLPSPGRRLQEKIKSAQLLLVTSQEIDRLGEEGNVPLARRLMDDLLHQLRRLFSILSDLGFQRIVVAADHGHLFGDEMDTDMRIDAPGGDTADLHRRVWVGKGGNSGDGYVRGELSALGLSDDLEFASPWGFACFKAPGGGTSFFHGGLSPQELVIPVMSLVPIKAEGAVPSQFDWTIELGSEKLSTRFASIQIKGKATGLFEPEMPQVRIEIRARGKSISSPVSASYGFDEGTGSAQLRTSDSDSREIEPNTITLMIVDDPGQKTVGLHLVDAVTGVELAKRDKIEVAISF